ncbi:MAG: serine hydrolase [Bacteroidetes bacterium]|nr:serine hydrolase [Bacteroidota bacterium]MCA6443516.1 serine hydrolase [Bacteroidota bacterium]
MKHILIVVLSLVVGLGFKYKAQVDPEFLKESKWVDSVFSSLSREERIAQLFMVAAYSNKDLKHVKEIKDLIVNQKIGGLIWMQGGPVRQGKLANYYQSIAKTPLLYSIDGEWGLSMRLDSTARYPKQMTLGAIQNDSLIYEMGVQIAKECKRIGLHINFAPDADVNNNPNNPVIGMRSFGENKWKVAQKAYMYMAGMQSQKVLATGKHFPGHGDTDSDSHKTLPQINHSLERIDSLELYPFKYLIERGLGSMMVAHLNIPALDTTTNLPSTLSPKIVNDLLKTKLNFKGVIFTDALNMQGVAKYYEPGIADVKALIAGNDILLFSGDVPKAMVEIKKAIAEGKISQSEVDEKCKKILKLKYWCGLYQKQEVVTRNLFKELNTPQSDALNDKLANAAITLLKNENAKIPFTAPVNTNYLEVSFGIEEENTFYKTLKKQINVDHIGIKHTANAKEISDLFAKVVNYETVIIQLNKTTLKADNNYGVGLQTLKLMDSIGLIKPTIVVAYANPYLLNQDIGFTNCNTLIWGYEYMPSMQRAAANLITGEIGANAKLPITTKPYPYNSGKDSEPIRKIKSQKKKELDELRFRVVDSIARLGIEEKAYPGCQIAVLKDGELIYQKSFGKYTYDPEALEVNNSTIYDLASLTKITSSALALMKLQAEKKFDYKKTLGFYLPNLVGTNKDSLLIEDVLTHQAGLQAWIPFYLKTMNKKHEFKPGYFSTKPTKDYSIRVAKALYSKKSFIDSIYKRIINSKLETKGKYVYSDLGYYFLQQIIEKLSEKKQNEFVGDIYRKLGLSLNYQPLTYFSVQQIAPTENDIIFRKQIVQGFVHDPGAALLGGVAGHAGLFGNAYDVAKLMQFYLDKGNFKGEQLIDSNIVADYTKCHFCPNNRRGLCFEKPEPDEKKDSPVTSLASLESFGHSGFTGTFAWADPKNKLVYVFLSNRVYPDVEPNKLAKSGIRGKIHRAFYEALK